jgi:hypothetical protein
MSRALAKLFGFIWTTLKVLLLMTFFAPLVFLLLDLHLGFGLLLLAANALYTLAPPARPPIAARSRHSPSSSSSAPCSCCT